MKILDNMQINLKRDITSSVCHTDKTCLSKVPCQTLKLVVSFGSRTYLKLYTNVLSKMLTSLILAQNKISLQNYFISDPQNLGHFLLSRQELFSVIFEKGVWFRLRKHSMYITRNIFYQKRKGE